METPVNALLAAVVLSMGASGLVMAATDAQTSAQDAAETPDASATLTNANLGGRDPRHVCASRI